jgi:hypothetical protein
MSFSRMQHGLLPYVFTFLSIHPPTYITRYLSTYYPPTFLFTYWPTFIYFITFVQPTYCQKHKLKPQEQRLKKNYKFIFKMRNMTRLYDLKIRTQELKTIKWYVQNKHENKSLLC